MKKSKVNLNDTVDAKIWAQEWMKVIKKNPNIATDEGTMLGWFANAIMAGYDKGRKLADNEMIIKDTRQKDNVISQREDKIIAGEISSIKTDYFTKDCFIVTIVFNKDEKEGRDTKLEEIVKKD